MREHIQDDNSPGESRSHQKNTPIPYAESSAQEIQQSYSALNPRQQAVLRMQNTYGNTAVRHMLSRSKVGKEKATQSVQRFGLSDITGAASEAAGEVFDDVRHASRLAFNPTNPLGSIFETVVLTNIASSSTARVPPDYRDKLVQYARDNPEDGVFLLAGLARAPTYHTGGWILDVQTGAKAMTLDTDVFVNGDLDIDTYVHEMVHVGQYTMGATAFLVSYFGLSAATIAWRLINREPLNMMDSSPHESQAYAIERRFSAWRATH